MKPRAELVPIPKGKPAYFAINIGTDAAPDVYWFRVPWYTETARLEPLVKDLHRFLNLVERSGGADGLANQEPALEELGRRMDHWLSVLGAFIGLYWWHPSKELEARPDDPAFSTTILDYGFAVVRELHEVGVPHTAVISMGSACGFRFLVDRARDSKVADRKLFFCHPTGPSTL